jgi:hypothetical protein
MTKFSHIISWTVPHANPYVDYRNMEWSTLRQIRSTSGTRGGIPSPEAHRLTSQAGVQMRKHQLMHSATRLLTLDKLIAVYFLHITRNTCLLALTQPSGASLRTGVSEILLVFSPSLCFHHECQIDSACLGRKKGRKGNAATFLINLKPSRNIWLYYCSDYN